MRRVPVHTTLKHASRAWYEFVSRHLRDRGFKQCETDQCAFVKHEGEHTLIVLLYVDDKLAFSDTLESINELETSLRKAFVIHACTAASSFVGMELAWSCDGSELTIGQGKYNLEVVQRYLTNNLGKKTPMDEDFQRLIRADTNGIDQSFRSEIGSLLYTSTVSRPDMATAVRILAQETECPTATVAAGVDRALQYLASSAEMGLVYERRGADITLEVFCDAAFACERESKSSTGYVVMLNGCCVAWGSKKQPIVTLSTTESEYVALNYGVQEAMV